MTTVLVGDGTTWVFNIMTRFPICVVFSKYEAFETIMDPALLFTDELAFEQDLRLLWERQSVGTRLSSSVEIATLYDSLPDGAKIASDALINEETNRFFEIRDQLQKKVNQTRDAKVSMADYWAVSTKVDEYQAIISKARSDRDKKTAEIKKNCIRINKDKLPAILTDKEQYTLKYLDHDPRLLIVVDTRDFDVSTFFRRKSAVTRFLIDGELYTTTFVYLTQAVKSLPSALTKNATIMTGACFDVPADFYVSDFSVPGMGIGELRTNKRQNSF